MIDGNQMLGIYVGAATEWGILTDKNELLHKTPTAEGALKLLQESIGVGAYGFMEQNGWHLDRVATEHKVIGVFSSKTT